MADFLDELISLQKEFKSFGTDLEEGASNLLGSTTSDGKAAPVWVPGDYKVVPQVNASMCVRCRNEDASCDLCEQICPVDAIQFTDDGDIDLLPNCRKCGLCVSVCPTDAFMAGLYNPRVIYDKICKAAETNAMVYVTCTRALGQAPHDAQVVLPCVGAVPAEVWYSVLCEYANVSVYLPRGICDKCRTVTGEDFYTEQISCGESWAAENVGLVERKRDLVLETDRAVERKQFMSNSMKSLGMTASKVNPITAKLAAAAQKMTQHSKQLAQLTQTLNKLTGSESSQQRKRILTGKRQLMLLALAKHPDTASNILFDLPVVTERCKGCGSCAESCPTQAIDLVDGKASILSTHCVTCSLCADVCPRDAIEFEEFDASRLIVDDPETSKQIEADKRQRQQAEEAREKGKELGRKALSFLEKEAEREEAEARPKPKTGAQSKAKPGQHARPKPETKPAVPAKSGSRKAVPSHMENL